MGERTSYTPGTFSWIDLGTTDTDAATAFYTGLMGWEAEEMPAGDAGTYTMLRRDGLEVGGLYAQVEPSTPPNWLSYVTVEDIDATTARAAELSGQVVSAPLDVMDAGRMAVLLDPQGAAFALWQPGRQIGADLVNAPGALSWNELATSDLEAGARFYADLFGWTTSAMPGGGPEYLAIENAGGTNGGMRGLVDGEAPHWTVYFGAEDVEAAASAATAAGGTVLAGPMPIPTGRFVVLADPQGAVFALVDGDFDP